MNIEDFLKFWRKNRGESLKIISERAHKKGKKPKTIGISESFFSQLENGKVNFNPDWCDFLAEVYDISEIIMHYFYSDKRDTIVHFSEKKGFYPDLLKQTKSANTYYKVPLYRLKNSDLIPVFSVIKPKGYTDKNHSHPGEEIAKITKGTLYLNIPHLLSEILLQEGDVIHFKSKYPHYYENRSDKPAEIFTVRKIKTNSGI